MNDFLMRMNSYLIRYLSYENEAQFLIINDLCKKKYSKIIQKHKSKYKKKERKN